MNKYIKDRIIILTILIIVFTFILSIPTYYLYQSTRAVIINEAGKRATGVAATIAKFIEQDIESYRKLSDTKNYSEGNYDKNYYNNMQTLFQNIKNEIGAKFVFTEKKISNTETAYVLDGENPNSNLFSPLGSMGNMETNELRAFDEGIIITSNLLHDETWGDLIKGYAPIKDYNTDEVVGLVGVDYTSKYVLKIINGIKNIIFIGLSMIIIFLTFITAKLLDSRFKSLNTDYLTNLYSKMYYEYYISKAIKDAQSKNQTVSLMMIDVDNFKSINDKYGHMFGDATLKAVANTIRTNTRNIDFCFRYGGDEFTVILPDTNEKSASMVAERIQEKLLKLDMNIKEDKTFKITLSIGIAEWSHNVDEEELTKRADQAMYLSKNGGKNRITVY